MRGAGAGRPGRIRDAGQSVFRRLFVMLSSVRKSDFILFRCALATMLGRLAQASIPSLTARLGALCVGVGRTGSAGPPAISRIATVPAQQAAPHQPQHLFAARFMGNKSCLKTNKSAAKRFRVRGSGSIKRNKAGMSHNTGYKSNTRKRRLSSSDGVQGKKIELRMRRLIGA